MKQILKKIIPANLIKKYFSIREYIKSIKNRIIRFFIKPQIPKNKDGKVLIHLGCGEKNDSRWINIDALPFPHVHYIQDVTNLSNLSSNISDIIYASHTLEHTSHRKTIYVLKEWRRVLKTGGILRLAVPDFDKIINIYREENNNMKKIIEPLMGGQDYKYNFHYSMFNKEYLTDILHQAGFIKVEEWNPKTATYHTFYDWSSKLVTIDKKRYPISLNIEAIK